MSSGFKSLIVVAIILSLILCGCVAVPKNSQIQQQAAPTVLVSEGDNLKKPYNYEKVESYVYLSTAYADTQPMFSHFLHKVESDSVLGKDAWHLTMELLIDNVKLSEGVKGYSEIWFEKGTDVCLKAQNVIENNGTKTISEGLCGPATTYGNALNVAYPYIGEETVTTSLGTFTAKKYGLQGAIIYYIAPEYGVPVKMVWGNGNPGPGTIFYELSGYS